MSSRKGHPRQTLSSSPSLHRPRNQSPRRLSSSPSSPSAIASPTVFRRRLAAASSAAVTASAYSQSVADVDRKGEADALRWRESFSSAPPQPSLLSSTASRPLPLRNTTSASILGDSSFSVVSTGAPSSASAGAVPNPGMVHIRRRVAESKARIQASVALRKQQQQLQRQQEEMYQLWSSSSSSKCNGEASAPATSHAAFEVPDSIVQSQRGVASPTMLALRRTWQPSASETGELATFVSPPSSPSSPGRGSPPLQLSSAPPSPQLNLVNGGVNDHEATAGGGLVAVHPLARQGSPPSQSKRRSSPLVLTPLRTSRSAFSDGELLTLENGFSGGRSSHRRSLESRGSPGSRSPGSRSPPFSSASNAAFGALQDWSQSAERPRDLVQVDGGGRRTSIASSEGSSVAGLRSVAGGRTRRRLPPTPGAVAIAEQQADMELADAGGVSRILQREIVVAPRLPPPPPTALGTPRFNVAVGASMELSRHVLQLGELRVPEDEPSFQWMLARSSGMARSKLGPQSGTCPHRSRLVSRLKELAQAERDCIDVETWGYGRKFAAGSHSPSQDDGAYAAVELVEDPVPLTAMLGHLQSFARGRPVENLRDVAVAGMAGRTSDTACDSTVNTSRRPTLTEVWDRRARDQTGTTLISSPRGSDQDEDRWQLYTNETGTGRSGRRGSTVRGEAGEGSRGGKNVSSAVREAMADLELDGAHFQTLV